MDRHAMETATKLLVKASSTPFDSEAAALTERAYRLMAGVLNAYDEQEAAGSGRKRERRHLRDRRAGTATTRPTGAAGVSNPVTLHKHRAQWIKSPVRGHVDLTV